MCVSFFIQLLLPNRIVFTLLTIRAVVFPRLFLLSKRTDWPVIGTLFICLMFRVNFSFISCVNQYNFFFIFSFPRNLCAIFMLCAVVVFSFRFWMIFWVPYSQLETMRYIKQKICCPCTNNTLSRREFRWKECLSAWITSSPLTIHKQYSWCIKRQKHPSIALR